jgi:hypothetical protein
MAEKKDKIINPFSTITVDQRLADLESLFARHSHDGRETQSVSGRIPNITSEAAAPTTTPKKIGDIFIRTDTAKVYISTGTSASTDWKILN